MLATTRRIDRPAPVAPRLPAGWSRHAMAAKDGGAVPTLVHEEAIVVLSYEPDAPDLPQLEVIANYTPSAGSALEDLGRWLRAGGRL